MYFNTVLTGYNYYALDKKVLINALHSSIDKTVEICKIEFKEQIDMKYLKDLLIKEITFRSLEIGRKTKIHEELNQNSHRKFKNVFDDTLDNVSLDNQNDLDNYLESNEDDWNLETDNDLEGDLKGLENGLDDDEDLDYGQGYSFH